jgi:hypothetical protein
MPSSRPRRTYDHRLRDLVRNTGNLTLATEMSVPRSSAAGWIGRPQQTVVSVDAVSMPEQELQAEVVRLRGRIRRLRAMIRILAALLRVFDVDLGKRRLSDGDGKSTIQRAIDRTREVLSLRSSLRILNLSTSRYHAWKRAEKACELDDTASCPRTSPQQLTMAEVRTIREMVTSPEYRHVPTGTLAVLAQRLGRVFASPTT